MAVGKAIGIGCGILLSLGAVAVVVAVVLVPRLLDAVREEVAEEQERQAIAAGWDAPDRAAAPNRVFPAAVGDYRLDRADDRAAVAELDLDAKGVHAAYSAGPSRVEVFAYPASKPEADTLVGRAERAYEGARGSGARSWTKIDLGESYARVHLSAPGLGQNHLWYTKGWVLLVRTSDAEDREGFVRAFLRTPRQPGGAAGLGP